MKKKRCDGASRSNSESIRESSTRSEIKKGSHSVLQTFWRRASLIAPHLVIQYPHLSALWLGETYLAGEMENSVIHRNVGLDFVDDDFLLVRRAFASELD
jgi:hypothetical protein